MKNVDNAMSIRPPRADLNQGSQPPTRVAGTSGTSAAPGDEGSRVSSDTVTFTNNVAEMLKLEENLANIPDIDDARVTAIKASIADGVYQIDPEKIVNGLLKIEKGFS
ncbi:MAG: flagellar biosynthesis anti-sigma factor FlgM [Gammaproteobacteria bacterium]|nr:MAG: flagellar biosynthesis anti-sigma factor FlgM [Gammaproteobacteria bacterium]RLA57977.1 MAG: flagellar biosynthesis anti-sigma factor FlgM [Gammaproteobacteria bacterium]HDY82118.1 flagellar biosynthesis anti-sigma factor FlgM [Halieaceae bacterium]